MTTLTGLMSRYGQGRQSPQELCCAQPACPLLRMRVSFVPPQAAIHAKPPPAGQWADCVDDSSSWEYSITWPDNTPSYHRAFEAGLKVFVYSGTADVGNVPNPGTQVSNSPGMAIPPPPRP